MKKSEIVVGGVYSNGKGRVRKVVAEGEKYVLYPGQYDRDCVRYEILDDGSGKKPNTYIANASRASFAAWAKERLGAGKDGRDV